MQFSGKRVVVTGACGVHGSWIVEAFAREGATLCLTDRREKELHALVGALEPLLQPAWIDLDRPKWLQDDCVVVAQIGG